jgi:hypothetical protein
LGGGVGLFGWEAAVMVVVVEVEVGFSVGELKKG